MTIQWVKIFSSNHHAEIDIAKAVLHEHGIVSTILDQTNSAIVPIGGELHLHVPNDMAEAAIKILEENNILVK